MPKEPIILTDDWVETLCAYMYMSSQISGEVNPAKGRSQTIVKTLFASLNLFSKVPEIESMAFLQVNLAERLYLEDPDDETVDSAYDFSLK